MKNIRNERPRDKFYDTRVSLKRKGWEAPYSNFRKSRTRGYGTVPEAPERRPKIIQNGKSNRIGLRDTCVPKNVNEETLQGRLMESEQCALFGTTEQIIMDNAVPEDGRE